MDAYRHHVSGFFAHREEANRVVSTLVERGLQHDQVHIFAADPAASDTVPEDSSNEVLKDVLVDSAIGTAVGTGIGALGSVALAVANVSLFIASPLLGPLTLLGWGATIGAFVGAAVGTSPGAGNKEGWLSDLISDAISKGQVVLVAETRTAEETVIAREVVQAAVGASQDMSMT